MSITTEVGIVNVALAELGQPTITALSDSNARARSANTLFEPERDAMYEDHVWNFAVTRVKLTIPDSAYKTVSGVTLNDPIEITATSHGFSDDDYVIFEDVGGTVELNGNRYRITNTAANSFDLYQIDGTTGYTTYTSGGTARLVPAFGPANHFDLPSDFLRIIRTQESADRWRIEGNKIVTDDTEVNLVYMAKVTDVALMSEGFIQALAARLAWKMAYQLTGSRTLRNECYDLYKRRIAKAMFNDSVQSGRTTTGGSTWTDGRLVETQENQPSGWADSV